MQIVLFRNFTRIFTACVIIRHSTDQSNLQCSLIHLWSARSPRRFRISTLYPSQVPWSTIFTKWYFTKLPCAMEKNTFLPFNLHSLRFASKNQLITFFKAFMELYFFFDFFSSLSGSWELKFECHFRFEFIIRGACKISFILWIILFCIILSWFELTEFDDWTSPLRNLRWLINIIFLFEFGLIQRFRCGMLAHHQPQNLNYFSLKKM